MHKKAQYKSISDSDWIDLPLVLTIQRYSYNAFNFFLSLHINKVYIVSGLAELN